MYAPSLDYPQTSFVKQNPVPYRGSRTGSTSSASSTSSSTSYTEQHNFYDKPTPSSLHAFGSRGSPMSSNSSARARPTPINIAKANEGVQYSTGNAGAPSPRAALVAGLRSATDRRYQEREKREMQAQAQKLLAQQQALLMQVQQNLLLAPDDPNLLLQKQTLLMQLHSFSQSQYLPAPSPMAARLSPPTSPIPYNTSNNNHNNSNPGGLPFGDPRLIASLQQQQQELMATSALIAQQQQRIQTALAYNTYDPMSFDFSQTSPVTYAASPVTAVTPQPYVPQQQHARNSVYYNDLPAPPNMGYYRPSSPNLPQRPFSSAAYRATPSGQQQQQQPSAAYQVPSKFSGANSSVPFRGSHRKAASLSGSGDAFNFTNNFTSNASSTPNYAYSNFSQHGSGSLGPIGSGHTSSLRNSSSLQAVPTGARVGGGELAMPSRQPFGPPPLDELKTIKRGSNFATLFA